MSVDLKNNPADIIKLLHQARNRDLHKARVQVEGQRLAFIFDQLQLPFPTCFSQCINGDAGVVIPLNPYGIVLRIETPDRMSVSSRVRVNNSKWALKPLIAAEAGFLVFEMCPGISSVPEESSLGISVKQGLGEDGYYFNDCYARNVGRLPIRTLDYPEGLPVTLDRLSAKRAFGAQAKLQSYLSRFSLQDIFYEELTDILKQAWPDTAKSADSGLIQQFWTMCVEYKKYGKLVDGWNGLREQQGQGFWDAEVVAARTSLRAAEYEQLLTSYNTLPQKRLPEGYLFNFFKRKKGF